MFAAHLKARYENNIFIVMPEARFDAQLAEKKAARERGQMREDPKVRYYPLKRARADETVSVLNAELSSRDGKAVADPLTNTMIVLGGSMAQIEAVEILAAAENPRTPSEH